jgi:large subunit ribosomal protein L35
LCLSKSAKQSNIAQEPGNAKAEDPQRHEEAVSSLTATGKVKHRRAGTSHLQVRVSAKRKQKLRGTGVLSAVDTPRIVEVLGKYSY